MVTPLPTIVPRYTKTSAYFLQNFNIASTVGDHGVYDLRGLDFEEHVYRSIGYMEIINHKLLTPGEFDPDGDFDYHITCCPAGHNAVYTTRTTFLVEDGVWYTFTRRSIDHSHRLYVNGEWLVDIGQPGATPETDIPDNGRITFTAQGVDGKIELVSQSTNHFHRYGQRGTHSYWLVSTKTMFTEAVRAEEFQTNIILGCFLVLAFLFILLSFTHGLNRAALYFALFCIVWFMRVGTTGIKVFAVLFPQLDWFARLRIEYLAIPATAVLTLAIINVLFPKVLHKPVLYVLYGVSAVLAAVFTFLDTLRMSHMVEWVYIIYGAAIVYATCCLIIRQFIIRRKINQPQIIFSIGLIVFFLAVLSEFGYLPVLFDMPQYQLAGVAMLVFALCEASAIFTAAMREREETIEAQHRLSAEVAVLENLSQLKTEYYNTLQSHITETRQARHDLRHHLSVFKAYIKSGETEKLAEYINDYSDSLPDDTEITFCDNYAVNSILRYYIAIAKSEGIKVDTHLELPENSGISDSDLCIIFGNCIENAIEACRRLDGDKFIRINSVIVGDMLAITIDNSFDGITDKENDDFISRKHEGNASVRGVGIGISSVKAVAHKYDGETRFEAKDDLFQVSVMLPFAE